MLESLPVILIIGTVLGFLTGLGVGGGSLLMLWLTVVLSTDQAIARSINLLFFLPSALIACLIRSRKKELDWKAFFPAILSGCLSAILFSFFAARMDTELLKKGFGIVLLAAGTRELLYRKKETGSSG